MFSVTLIIVMQIGPIINIASASPAIVAQGGAVNASGQTPNAAAATDLTAALITAPAANITQFSNLLVPNVKAGKALDAVEDTAQVNPQGDAAKAPQATASIAIPLYIDQPISVNPVKPTDDAVLNNTAPAAGILNNKQPIFNQQLFTSGKNLAAASEVADKQLDAEVKGKVPLQQFADDTQIKQDPEFAKAVANIVDQAKNKNLTVAANKTPVSVSNNGEQEVVAKLPPVTNTNTSTNSNQVAKSNDDNQQQLASTKNSDTAGNVTKITAKVLGVKEEKIDGDNNDQANSPTLTASLQDFASQLKTKSFSEVKAAHQALAPSPVDQVQVKISQALAAGTNTIKIHLHPTELGMVDVDLDTDHEGNTKISITADKAETLSALRNDSHNLTKSLADAGIKTDNATMQFNLRGDSQGQQQRDFGSNNFQQNNQNSQQQAISGGITGYSRFTNLSEQTLTLSANKGLNILV